MLLSESLLRHRSFALDGFNLPRLEPEASTRDHYVMNGDIWQVEIARGRIYYYFPPGSSVLSVPFVLIANALGISAANPDGTYSPENETRIQKALAALLMGLTAVIFYFTSRRILPYAWSIVIALAGAFATQIWSTASRGLWSHTWAVLLISVIVYLLLASETRRQKLYPIALATLLAWLYFVRPNGSIVIVAVTIYLLLFHRKRFAYYALTGALWLAGFIAYSWTHFGKPLPSYYRPGRLRFDLLPEALAGNVLSPSRGLFIYVPVLLFVLYLLIRFRQFLPLTRLVWLSLAICVLHILFVSMFANLWGDWWGGASFGPRYTTELVPWLVLLGGLGLQARRVARKSYQASVEPLKKISLTGKSSKGFVEGPPGLPAHSFGYVTELVVGLLLLALSVFINARGATSLDTWKWSQPTTDQQLRSQLWDWRHPQFLAGLQPPPPAAEYPLLQIPTVIDVTAHEGGKYLWYGWSGAENKLRWTDGKEATVVFSLTRAREVALEIRLAPFVSGSLLAQQTLIVKLNDQTVSTVTLSDGEIRAYSFALPRTIMKARNVLALQLPNATSPASLNVSNDSRMLGVKVESLRFTDAD
jgi:hypothetical protein